MKSWCFSVALKPMKNTELACCAALGIMKAPRLQTYGDEALRPYSKLIGYAGNMWLCNRLADGITFGCTPLINFGCRLDTDNQRK